MEDFKMNLGNEGDKDQKEKTDTEHTFKPHHTDESGRVISEDEFQTIRKEKEGQVDSWREQK